MNILFNNNFFVGFMVSEIPRVSVFGHYPYSVTFPNIYIYCLLVKLQKLHKRYGIYYK